MLDPFHRRFLVNGPGTLPSHSRPSPVHRALLAHDAHRRITLRQIGEVCSQIVETRTAGSWKQVRCRLQQRQFSELWSTALYHPLSLQRFRCKLPDLDAWTDAFQGPLTGLHVATVRFTSHREAFRWTPLPELGPEITFDSRFHDAALMHAPLRVAGLPVNPDQHKSNFVVGVLPYLQSAGQVEIVAVHTRKKALTIFPKGQPEPHLGAREVARLEALEEAGVEGTFTGHPILMPYKTLTPQHWVLYPLEVQTIHSEWREKGIRNRRLIKLREALHHPSCLRLLPALRYLDLHLSRT